MRSSKYADPAALSAPNAGTASTASSPQAAAVQQVPSPGLDYRRHRLRVRQAALDHLVSGHLFPDPIEKRRLGDAAASAAGHWLQRRLAHESQVMHVMEQRTDKKALERPGPDR